MSLRIPTSLLLVFVLPALALAQAARDLKCNMKDIPQIVDVTKGTGITFQHVSAPEKKYIVESMGGGLLLIDFDRDGWIDIYFPNALSVADALAGKKSRSALYRNNGDFTFTDVSAHAGVEYPCWAMGGAVGDINNDGWPDMYVTCLGANVLYRNNGDGTFSDVAKAAGVDDKRWSAGASFGDFDADGWLDLMVTNYVDFRLDDLPKFGQGATCQFRGLPVQCGPRGLKGAGDSLYRNLGDGTFADVSKSAGVEDASGHYGLGVTWSDFNNDGRLDIFVANDATPNHLYRNDGGGKFTDVAFTSGTAVSADGAEQACMGVAVGDYMHSGRFSIFVTNFADEYYTLYRNDGDMQFSDVAYQSRVAVPSLPYVGWGTGFFDFDDDGWVDLLAVNGHVYPQVDTLSAGARYRQPKLLYMNRRDGTFCDASEQAGPALRELRSSRGAAFGDLNNDGRVDVVVADVGGSPMVLKNAGTKNNWIGLELAGAKGNRLAIGARVTVTSGDLVQVEEVRSGGSYLSQNDLRLHFGLGERAKVDSVEIRWPSGKKESLKDLAAGNYYTVLEGEGVVPAERIRPKRAAGKK